MAAIVGVFGSRLGFGAAEDDRHHAEHQDLGGVAAGLGGRLADRRHARRDHLGRRSRHEHAFGVLGGELPSARRGAGLIQHGGALRRRFAEVNGVEPVILALVPDRDAPWRDRRRCRGRDRAAPRRPPSFLPRACRPPPYIRRRSRSGRHARSACPCRRRGRRCRDSRSPRSSRSGPRSDGRASTSAARTGRAAHRTDCR